MSIEITQEELTAELERIWNNRPSDAGLTVAEYREALGWSNIRTQKVIRDGVRAGTIIRGVRRIEKDWDGRPRTYTVYRPVGAK